MQNIVQGQSAASRSSQRRRSMSSDSQDLTAGYISKLSLSEKSNKCSRRAKILPKTMLKTEPQRYEAYERKEEERRDLASDYLQVEFF